MSQRLFTDFSDRKTLEKYSSAFTLSDMEIFIFPELFYPLVLSNIISPIIWEWRKDPWFTDIEKKSFNYKVNRIKQFIIQNYVFNLDLATWGLTTKSKELDRFRDIFDTDLLRKSNALFGYEGDKYYFDIDIRKHFGLDKYDSDIIPYWKTETVEAMTAFRHKSNFVTGAGECVSLSALYAAAMFVIGRIPLEKIFLIATPLHSQNFLTEKEGLITNNRRIVTKTMWYNGTSLSEKARRALENEQVTIVSHISGYIHVINSDATIDPKAYNCFASRLKKFLNADLTGLIFINFLRFRPKYKTLFQYECECSGKKRYITLEKMFEYEHISRFKLSSETRDQLIKEIEGDEFHLSPMPGKVMLNDVEKIIDDNQGVSLKIIENLILMLKGVPEKGIIREMFTELEAFVHIEPRLPETNKNFIKSEIPEISVDNSREEIIYSLMECIDISELSQLTFYVNRQMDRINWLPFIKAAVERNPVCFNDLKGKSYREVYDILCGLSDISIYDGQRLALPDEVWNFRCGDGIEKALLLADLIVIRDSGAELTVKIDNDKVVLHYNRQDFEFRSKKSFVKTIKILSDNMEISSDPA